MNHEYLMCYMIVDVFCIVLANIVAANVRDDSGSETQVRYFRFLITSYNAFVITDLLWAYTVISGISTQTEPIAATLNGLNRVAVTLAAYFWFCYGESRFESRFVYNRTQKILAAVPLMCIVPLYLAGAALGLYFTVNPDGSVANGPTYVAITVIGLLYLIGATASALMRFRRAESRAERKTCLVFVSFMIAPAACALLDAFVPNMPLMAPAMMISILLVLLSLQESRISNDALTGLNNRRRADAFLEESLGNVDVRHPLYLFLVDMNKFKEINDTYGHLEGDHALQLMAAALRKSCAELDSFAARWGGDEFVMICVHDIGDDPAHAAGVIKARLLDEAREHHVEYELSCTVGYAKCDSAGYDPNQLVSEADEALYLGKQALKQLQR